jgi:hypothetical protein
MQEVWDTGADQGGLSGRRSTALAARALAVSALLLAAMIVLAVLLEARGHSGASTHLRPLSKNLFSP